MHAVGRQKVHPVRFSLFVTPLLNISFMHVMNEHIMNTLPNKNWEAGMCVLVCEQNSMFKITGVSP